MNMKCKKILRISMLRFKETINDEILEKASFSISIVPFVSPCRLQQKNICKFEYPSAIFQISL